MSDQRTHFIQYGAAERPNPTWGGVNVGANFDEEAYLAANKDVADAIEAGIIQSAYQHYLL